MVSLNTATSPRMSIMKEELVGQKFIIKCLSGIRDQNKDKVRCGFLQEGRDCRRFMYLVCLCQ